MHGGTALGALCKNILLVDLLRSQHLLEILLTSLTFRNSENVVKSRCFKKRLRWRAPIFFRNEGRCKVPCVKIFIFQ